MPVHFLRDTERVWICKCAGTEELGRAGGGKVIINILWEKVIFNEIKIIVNQKQ